MQQTSTATQFSPSENVAKMRESSIFAMVQAGAAMRAAGIDVVDCSVGEPDFDTPDHIKQAAVDSLWGGHTKYTATGGTPPLHQAIIEYYEREFGAVIDISEVMATAGGKQAIFNAIMTLVGPGDDVLIPKPYWVTFPEIVMLSGATPVYIETEETDFVLTVEQVKRAITPRTRLLILNSPSNPSGRVIPPAEFRKIIELAVERGLYVISDECYLRFVYPPGEVFTAASLAPELRARVCVAGSFSKTYAMTGLRIGYALAPAQWIKAMLKVQGHSTSNPTTTSQAAAIECYTGPQECVARMLNEYHKRRDFMVKELSEIPGFRVIEPEGAFYAFPDIRGCLKGEVKTSGEFVQQLLHEGHTVVTDGAGFGQEGYIRISYATSLERLQEGVKRIRSVAERLAV